MVLKVVVTCVVVLGVVVTPESTIRESQPKEWPCPGSTEISPCICTADPHFDMSLDCSLVKSNDELARVFSSVFPFGEFVELTIQQNPSDPEYNLNALEPNIFIGLSFERIIITGTKLTAIEENTFSDSYKFLSYLNLSDNKITYFPFQTLLMYTELQTLILDDNQIDVLPSIQSDSLEILSISGNEEIQLTDFLGTPALREIYLARNKLEELPFKWVWDLLHLTVVDLEGNEIAFLDEYYIASQSNALATINLDYNKITGISYDAFQGLLPDAVVSMRNNTVVELDEDSWSHLFDQLVPTGTLDLAGNPLRCGCDMAWILFSPQQTDLSIFTNTTTCKSGGQVIHLDVQLFCDLCLPNNCSEL
ncbi:hypothetical protein OTU49_011846 [Cherax quadricarinatus]|uniref:Oplophorus-luciferin 2-monooxygenase non-catalytic subunit n=1 Tax=Cherax quadricarinatus TaxID=27406 RepID=A0AAW0W1U1_CHEQU|nr:oplophorus-luciferin 2-monooxygenase non-catalytic subunit-like [Cherax quadricarinatus]